MRTAVYQNDLQLLERWLQKALDQEALEQEALEPETEHCSWQVRAALKQSSLIIVVQHPEAMQTETMQTETMQTACSEVIAPNPDLLFTQLEQALQSFGDERLETFKTAVGNSKTLPVRFYLRKVGQQQPYASRVVSWEAIAPGQETFSTIWAAEQADGSNEETTQETASGAIAPPTTDDVSRSETAIAQLPQPVATESLVAEPHASTPKETSNPEKTSTPDSVDVLDWLTQFPVLSRIPIPILGLSAALGLLALGIGLYGLTRPCVIGGCAPLVEAQRLSQDAASRANSTATAQDVVAAHQQLIEANYLLGTIPKWSGHYDNAQTLLQSYETRTEVFGQVVAAVQKANVAAEKSQNSPYPVTTWREVQQLWQEAIALLETIPSDSSVYLLSQRKRSEYEANLTAINHRIRVELEAQERIDAARKVANVAEAREAAATSVVTWRSARDTWQVVVNALKNIPQGTMAYAEAQQLLGIYQPRLAATRDRHTQEQLSATAYNQALTLAEQARQAEQRQQWSEAVNQWRNALSNVEQVPNGTSYHSQIEPLVATYQTALASAQDRMRSATALQTATADLDQVCAATSTICTYTIQANAIRVQLTPDYDWAIEAVISNTPLRGDANTQAALKAYVDQLLDRFAEVGQQAQLPLDFYNAGDRLFGTYDPQFGGYVKR
jgi:hypothetical protein